MHEASEPLQLTPASDPKNPKRGPRKFGSGERGFQTGTYPRRGPFTIYAKRPTKRGDTERDGRTFYVLDEYRAENGRLTTSPPPEGWAFYLARTYGPGTYRVHHVDENNQPARAVMFIPPHLCERAGERDDDRDDERDDDTRDNPPIASDLERTLASIEALRRAQEVLTPPAAPGLLETLAANPGLMQLLAAAIKPPSPPPAPPAAPKAPPTDPWSIVAKHAAANGITPEQAIQILAERMDADAESAQP